MISEMLAKIRKERKLTMKNVADAIGVSLSAYQKYENGTCDTSTTVLLKLADFYHVSTDYLLGRDTSDSNISNITTQFNLSPLERQILEKYLMLLEDKRDSILEWLEKSVNEDNENGGE